MTVKGRGESGEFVSLEVPEEVGGPGAQVRRPLRERISKASAVCRGRARSPLLFVPRGLPDPDAPAWAPLASTVLGDLVAEARGLLVAVFERASDRRRAGLVLRGMFEEVRELEAAEAFDATAGGVLLADREAAVARPAILAAARCLVVSRLALPWPRPPWIPAPGGEDPCRFVRHDLPLGVAAFQAVVEPFLASVEPGPHLLAILDPRLVDRPYGRWFLNALPPLRRSRDLDEAVTCLRGVSP